MNRVIDQMTKAEGDVERQLRKYIPEIIKECMAFAYLGKTFTFDISDLSDRVNQKLVALSDAILEDIESRAQKVIRYADEEEDEDDILLYINRTIGEENLVQRLDKHCSTLRYFLEGWIAIGIVNKIKGHELTNIILSHIDNPLSSALWQDALNAGYLSNAIRSGLYQYGKGNQKNVLSALTEIERYSINEAFQYGCILKYGKMGAIGYRTYRQSSYPCDHCDELTMRVWPLDTMVLPAHPRCVCRSEPVFADEITGSIYAVSNNSARRQSQGANTGKQSSLKLTDEQKAYRKSLQEYAKRYAGQVVNNVVDVIITNTGVKEFLNQPYIHYFEKNELVRDIPSLIKNSRYVKKVKYHKDSNPDIIFSHLFELYIKNHRSYLIARESKSGQITFHSITDNPDAMD